MSFLPLWSIATSPNLFAGGTTNIVFFLPNVCDNDLRNDGNLTTTHTHTHTRTHVQGFMAILRSPSTGTLDESHCRFPGNVVDMDNALTENRD